MIDNDFKVGDIITRDGTDRQRVVETDGDSPPTTITVECVREPATDGLSPKPWCKIGEREFTWPAGTATSTMPSTRTSP